MNELLCIAIGVAGTLATVRLARRGQASGDPSRPETPATGDPASHPPKESHPPKDLTDAALTASKVDVQAAVEQEPPAAHQPLTASVSAEPRAMAISMAEELASLISTVEARATHLVEAAPTRTQLPAAAEALFASIDRVRTLHAKLIAFGRGRIREYGTTDVTELVAGLGDELQHMQLGLEVRWEPPTAMPPLGVKHSVARDIMLFACAALLRAERGATRLSFNVEPSFSQAHPTIKIELTLEYIAVTSQREIGAAVDQTFALDLEAARNLVVSHGGELTLTHLPGTSVRAVVRLPMAIREDRVEPPPQPEPDVQADESAQAARQDALAMRDGAPQDAATSAPRAAEAAGPEPEVDHAAAAEIQPRPEQSGETPPPAPPRPAAREPAQPEPGQPAGTTAHRYGGALVLEADPALRSVLARELKASGRAVFACADGDAANTFLEATPDRFELLIVDDENQLASKTPLARTIQERVPNLKICLLTTGPSQAPAEWPNAHCLQKPFGVHELRRTLASILPIA
ncbi:MAG: hypothetical protein AB8H80_02200 [Planctomycetota bacterium]